MGSIHNSHGPRRETSLLVSPVSHHSSTTSSGQQQRQCHHHSRSPQSEMSGGNAFGNRTVTFPEAAAGNYGASAASASSAATTASTAGLTIHTNLQANNNPNKNNGRDPTPYHYRSNPSTTPPSRDSNKSKASSDASSTRSGRDPPAKSPFPTSIMSTSAHSGSGYLVTSKSTPNVHSHHYQRSDHHQQHHHHHNQHHHHHYTAQEDRNDLSMIEEDDSHDGQDNQSLMSNVTGSTYVRTPVLRKLHAGHTPHNNNVDTASAEGLLAIILLKVITLITTTHHEATLPSITRLDRPHRAGPTDFTPPRRPLPTSCILVPPSPCANL